MTSSKKGPRLFCATEMDILEGKVTDVYFRRTNEILRARGVRKRVAAEIAAKSLREGWTWGVFAGLEEVLAIFEGRDVDVRAMEEGSVFSPGDPVLTIEGDYLEFGIYETALLGLLCQASGIATISARYRLAAGGKTLVSFGARRMHPVIAPMIERYAYIGGCDGVAVVKSAEELGIEPTGTMPHALILVMGDPVSAFRAYHETVDASLPRIALVDTFGDEKFEAIRACETLGDSLYAVRLDTPSTRRGDFRRIIEEVRWEMDLRGYEHVKILVSGGLGLDDVRDLRDLVDGFGVGTAISNAPVVDYAMDIVEVEGEPLAKRGKKSGLKDVYRSTSGAGTKVVPRGTDPDQGGREGGAWEPALTQVIHAGRLTGERRDPRAIRDHVLSQLAGLDDDQS